VTDFPLCSSGGWRAVLFDYFGTLTRAVRRGPVHRRIARELGCAPDDWFSMLEGTFYRRAAGEFGPPVEALRMLAEGLGAQPSRRALEAAYATRIRAVGEDGPLRPEAVATLQALRRRGLRTAVVSDCWYELPLLLPRLPVYPLLDARVYSVEVGRCKPHPDIYLRACGQLGVTPADCLYVGDGGSRELTGAAALGMSAVRLDAPDLAGHLRFEPDVGWSGPAIGSLREVVSLVDGQRGSSDVAA